MKKINLKTIGKLLPILGIILFIYILVNYGVDKISRALSIIPIHYYFIAFLPFFLRLALFTTKWQYICKKQKMYFSKLYLAKIFLICLFYGNVIPGGFGWHIRIFYLCKKGNVSIEKCLTNSMLDSNTGFITGLFLSLIGSIVLVDSFPGLFPLVLLFLIVQITVFVVLIRKSRGNKLFKYLIRPLIPKKYRENIDKSVESLYEDIPRLRDLIIPFLLEVGIYIAVGAQFYIIAMAFSVNIPFFTFILINAISSVATGILHMSVGGLGVREGAFVLLLSSFGVKPEIAIAISIGGFIVKRLVPAIFGLIISIKERIK